MADRANPDAAPPPSFYVEQHPNPDLGRDRGLVLGALAPLLVFGALDLLLGVMLLTAPAVLVGSGRRSDSAALDLLLSLFTLGCGVTYLALAQAMHRRRNVGAAQVAFVLAGLELAASLLTLNLLSVAIDALKLWLIKRGHDRLLIVRDRIWDADQRNLLTEWYHAYIPLLVHVMKADGAIPPEELAEMQNQCNRMNISAFEQDLVFQRAMDELLPIPLLARRYLSASERLHMGWPQDKLLTSLTFMAAADKVILKSEKDVIRRIADAIGYPREHLEIKLKRAEGKLTAENRHEAELLFSLPPGAGRDQIEARYQELLAQHDPAQFAHVGDDVAAQVHESREAIERSYRLLTHGK